MLAGPSRGQEPSSRTRRPMRHVACCGASGGPPPTRREFLREYGLGFGNLALAYLLHADGRLAAAADSPSVDLRPRPGHFPARAKSIVLLFQNGGPSHMDLFDPKPELQKRGGQTFGQDVEVLQPGNSN